MNRREFRRGFAQLEPGLQVVRIGRRQALQIVRELS